MTDTWTKKSPSGKNVVFEINGDRDAGFVYSAKMDGRDIVQTSGSLEEPTREQVEACFAECVSDK